MRKGAGKKRNKPRAKQKEIAFVSVRIASTFVNQVLRGVEDQARKSDNLAINHYAPSNHDAKSTGSIMKTILEEGNANAIIVLSLPPDDSVLSECRRQGIPVVFVERGIKGQHSIKVNNQLASKNVVEHLVKKGRKNFNQWR